MIDNSKFSILSKLVKMWKTLLEKKKDDWRKMNFSLQSIKKLIEMKKMIFDKQFPNFLELCSVADHFKVSAIFLMVYESFEQFIKQVQGNDQIYSKFIISKSGNHVSLQNGRKTISRPCLKGFIHKFQLPGSKYFRNSFKLSFRCDLL